MLIQAILQIQIDSLKVQGIIGERGSNICGLSLIIRGTLEYCDDPFNNDQNCPKIVEKSLDV